MMSGLGQFPKRDFMYPWTLNNSISSWHEYAHYTTLVRAHIQMQITQSQFALTQLYNKYSIGSCNRKYRKIERREVIPFFYIIDCILNAFLFFFSRISPPNKDFFLFILRSMSKRPWLLENPEKIKLFQYTHIITIFSKTLITYNDRRTDTIWLKTLL